MKKIIIYYSGPYNINAPGATNSIDIPLISEIVNIGYEVIWIGCGESEVGTININLESRYKSINLIRRLINKLKRELFGQSEQTQALQNFIYYDNKVSKLIIAGKVKINQNTIFISRSGVSTKSFSIAKNLGAKTILHSSWCHPFYQKELVSNQLNSLNFKSTPILDERAARQLEEIEIVDKIWCISKLVEDSYSEAGISKEKLFLSPLGVDHNRYNNQKIIRSNDIFTILFVGNVNPEKGVHLLIKALIKSNLENIKIIFNGSVSKYFDKIFKEMTLKLNNKKIIVEIGPGNPNHNYATADLFILPSVHDSFGLVVLEAMANGMPIIISDGVGAKDCIENGIDGSIFENGDINQLSLLINKYYNDEKLRWKIGKNAKKQSFQYSWDKVSETLISQII